MDCKKETPFGAFDSELMHQEITIPEGFEATIDGNKIILIRKESKGERIKRVIRGWINTRQDSFFDNGFSKEEMLAWLESIKDRDLQKPIWKPSEKQMRAFEHLYNWYNNNYAPSETLTSLYNDLKKL